MTGASPSRDGRPDLVDLIARCVRGDESAWPPLLAEYSAIAERTLSHHRFRRVTVAAKIEITDSARDRFVDSVRAGNISSSSSGAIVVYVRTIVRNRGHDHLRRLGSEERFREQDIAGRPTISPELRAVVARALDQIASWPERDQFVFLMKLRGVPAEEIADDYYRQFGEAISPKTVETRYHRLRRRLAGDQGDRSSQDER